MQTRSMAHPIAQRMEQISFSGIRTIFEKANKLEQAGRKVIHLEQGRPDFDTPEHIKLASQEALAKGAVHYTSNYGILPLRQAIAHKLAHDNGISVDPESELIVTAGVSEGLMMSMLALLNPGDEVLIPEPVFPVYLMTARMAGAIPVTVPTSEKHGYKPQLSDLKAKLTSKTKMLVINTPGNPTGCVLGHDDLERIAHFAIGNDLLVLSDEIYEKLIYDGQTHVSIASLPGMKERTITLNGFSKSYAMTGWRMGYLAADRKLIDALIRIHQYSVVCSTSFAQWGALAALEGPQNAMQSMQQTFARRRNFITHELGKIPGITFAMPQGALYVYIDVSHITDNAYRLADQLLEHSQIAVVPWDKQHIRIAYGNSHHNLEIAMQRMQHALGLKLAAS